MWGTQRRSPPTGLHALNQDNLSYSPWKTLTLQEGGTGCRSGVRGRREMGHSTGTRMWGHVQSHDQHAFTNKHSLTCLVGSALC